MASDIDSYGGEGWGEEEGLETESSEDEFAETPYGPYPRHGDCYIDGEMFPPQHFFVPNDTWNRDIVALLGEFRRPVAVEEIFAGEARDNKDWYLELLKPFPYQFGKSSSASLPLFSLAGVFQGFLTSTPDANGNFVRLRSHRLVGLGYSLPIHPSPTVLVTSSKHPLQTDLIDECMFHERMVGSCDGLYCLRDDRRTLTREYEVIVIVWNPTTGLFRKLPPYVPCNREFTYDDVVFGFGYDPSSKDYKVVKIDVETLEVEVFSLYSDSNSWRTVPGLPLGFGDFWPNSSNGGVYCAGRLNWLLCANLRPSVVASFDLQTERFQTFLDLPPTYNTQSLPLRRSSLYILDGSLSFVCLHDLSPEPGLSESRRRSRVLDIWKIRGYKSSWTNAATIVFPHSVSFPYRILYLSMDVLILAVERLLVFNLKDNSLVCPHIGSVALGVEPYVKSKVSPKLRFDFNGEEKEEERRLEKRGYNLFSKERLESVDWELVKETGYCSNSECFVVYIERRTHADPAGRRRPKPQTLKFVPQAGYKSEVNILGTFSKSIEPDDKNWHLELVRPLDNLTHIPSPSLPLFTLTKVMSCFPLIDAEEEDIQMTSGLEGKSYSLPLHPPSFLLIPPEIHYLQTEVKNGKMVGCSNGLYCLQDYRKILIDGISERVLIFIVWNPTTSSVRRLPYLLRSNSVSVSGFGYDQSSNNYKVLNIHLREHQVDIFSLYSNSESWRSVQGLPEEIFDIGSNSEGVYFAGCLNWLLDPYPEEIFSLYSNPYPRPTKFASFDLATERFQILPLPPTYGAESLPLDRLSLCILDGCLSFVGLYDLSLESGLSESKRRSRALDIWIIRGYESSWTNAAKVVFPHSVSFPYRILYLSKDVLILAAQRLFVFNIRENSLVSPDMDGIDLGVEPYVQSQVCPNSRSQTKQAQQHNTG